MFDALSGDVAFDVAEIEKSDAIEMYRKRREDACALWATIPDENFYIGRWKEKTDCGTVCCAIGWLAEMEHDGWTIANQAISTFTSFHEGTWSYPVYNKNISLNAYHKEIHKYFALNEKTADIIFGINRASVTRSFYKKETNEQIKLSDVSRELMAAPYEIA